MYIEKNSPNKLITQYLLSRSILGITELGDDVLSLEGELAHYALSYLDMLPDQDMSEITFRTLSKRFAQVDSLHTCQLVKNTLLLSQRLQLSDVECSILICSILAVTEPVFAIALESLGSMSSLCFRRCLSSVIGCAVSEINECFSPTSPLIKHNIISVKKTGLFSNHLIVLAGLQEVIAYSIDPENDILSNNLFLAKPSSLSMESYPEIQSQIFLLKNMIQSSIENGKKGVNILIYGDTGVGKTELAKVLSSEMPFNGYFISPTLSTGCSRSPIERLGGYDITQGVSKAKGDLFIIFDGADDVKPFMSDKLDYESKHHYRQQMFETNSLPTIWIMKDVKGMSQSIIRRFNYILEVPKLSSKHLAGAMNLMMKNYGVIIKESISQAICHSPDLVFSDIENAVKQASQLSHISDPGETVLSVINGSLKAKGKSVIYVKQSANAPYDVDFIHCDIDLPKLIIGLKKRNEGRICISGPSGTGKSAFARHVATELGMPIVHKKASDILSRYIGDNEKNIAKIFNEAKQTQSVIIIDEGDMFLSAREGLNHQWQRSVVNEFLVQLEDFNGLLFITTNHYKLLDKASIRRFDLKLEFNYLSGKQTMEMAKRTLLNSNDFPRLISSCKRFTALKNITPGDFSVVSRKMMMLGEVLSEENLFLRLEDEVTAKNIQRGIGFVA